MLTIIAIAWQHSEAKKYQNDATGIIGQVRSYTIWSYTKGLPESVKVDSNWNYISTATFDKSGKYINITSGNRKKITVITYEYDEQGRQKAMRRDGSHLMDTSFYEVNAKGNLVERKGMTGNTGFIFVYNKYGYRDTMYVNNTQGKPVSKVIYHYKSQGKLTETLRYNADNSLDYREVYTYNKTGDEQSRVRYDEAGKVKNKNNYEYDKHHNLILKRDSGSYLIGSEHVPFLEVKKYRYSNFDTNGNWQREDALSGDDKVIETQLRKLTYYK